MIAVFIFISFYFNHKSQKNYEKLLLKKQNLRDRYYEAINKLNNPSDVELMFGDSKNIGTQKNQKKNMMIL